LTPTLGIWIWADILPTSEERFSDTDNLSY